MNECKCLNNGQCVMNNNNNNTLNYSCICNDCTDGEFCENHYYYVRYSMSSSMLIDILMEELNSTRIILKIIFIFMFSILNILSFISNLLTFSICLKQKIRITVCGIYIILYSIFSFIGMILLEIIAIVLLFYNNDLKKHSLINCALLPTFLNFTYDICLWLSAFIAVEHVLIQYSYGSLYRTRKYSIIFLIILFLFFGSGNVITALGRTVGKSPVLSTSYVCSFHHFSNKNLEIAYKILGSIYIDFVMPLLLNFLSILLTLTRIIYRKITLNNLERHSWQSLIMQQISKHKDFFIPPLVIIICTLPEKLLLNIAETYCIEKTKQKFYLRLHIALDFLLYIPLVITFFIYIYPSKVYMKLFDKIRIIKWIKLKILTSSSRPRSSNIVQVATVEQIIEETSL